MVYHLIAVNFAGNLIRFWNELRSAPNQLIPELTAWTRPHQNNGLLRNDP